MNPCCHLTLFPDISCIICRVLIFTRGELEINTAKSTPHTIDEYITGFPAEIQSILNKIRVTVRDAAPQAEEAISYQMPTFKLEGNLVHFAAYKNHIGFYPAPSGIENFDERLSHYKRAKGSVRFPLDEPIPYDLISEIVRFRVSENLERAEAKRQGKK